MKFNQNISLAYYNLICKSKFSLKMISSIMLIIIVLSFCFLVTRGIEKYYEKLVVDNSRTNNIYYELNLSKDGSYSGNDLDTLKKLQKITGIEQPIIYSDINLLDMLGEQSNFYISTNRINLVQETEKKTFKVSNYAEDNLFDMCFLSGNNCYFTENDKKSFSYYYPDDNLILAGNVIQNNGDIVVTDTLLKQFEIDNYNELIGKQFSICIDGKKYIENVRLVGVYNNKISDIDFSKFYPAVIYCGSQKDIYILKIEKLSVCMPINDFKMAAELGETLKNANLSNKVLFDEGNAKVLVYVNYIRQLVYYIIFLVMTVGVIAIFLSLCSILYNRISENISYYAMMRAVGMRKSDLLFLLYSEQLLLIIAAAFFSLPFASTGLYLINYLLQNVLESEIIVTLGEFTNVYANCMLVIFIGLLIVSTIFLIFNQKEEISVLLKGMHSNQ